MLRCISLVLSLVLAEADIRAVATEDHRNCRFRNSLVRPFASAAAAAL